MCFAYSVIKFSHLLSLKIGLHFLFFITRNILSATSLELILGKRTVIWPFFEIIIQHPLTNTRQPVGYESFALTDM